MGFVEATKNYFIKWKDFDTRVSRSEYWWGTLGVLIISLLLGFCDRGNGRIWRSSLRILLGCDRVLYEYCFITVVRL